MSNCCTSNGCCKQSKFKKVIRIDFLYLDLSVCDRCQNTEKVLDEAIDNVNVVLTAAGFVVKVNKVNIISRELALKYCFVSSPTIRVNGRDIESELKESLCEDCGTLCGDSVDCRVWVYNELEYTSPPKELIINAILKEVYTEKQCQSKGEKYELPQNLDRYFTAIEKKGNKEGDRI